MLNYYLTITTNLFMNAMHTSTQIQTEIAIQKNNNTEATWVGHAWLSLKFESSEEGEVGGGGACSETVMEQ